MTIANQVSGEELARRFSYLLQRAWFMLAYVPPSFDLAALLLRSGYWAAAQAVRYVRDCQAASSLSGVMPDVRPEDSYVFYGVFMEAVYIYALKHTTPGFAITLRQEYDQLAQACAPFTEDAYCVALLAYWRDLCDELAGLKPRVCHGDDEEGVF